MWKSEKFEVQTPIPTHNVPGSYKHKLSYTYKLQDTIFSILRK